MTVRDLFRKNIFRPINGVVKADQTDESTVWQELDEFVVTRELTGHIQRFFGAYVAGLDNPRDVDITGRIGVWVAGFFGSGKSHLIKILSYVLANAPHTHAGETKRAAEFFTAKIPDPLALADIQKAAASDTDVILFNIDSRADVRGGRDAILSVFLKVLNELAGYCPEHPHIAHMERYLDEKGTLDAFRTEFQRLTGHPWEAERDAYAFNRDEVVQAFSKATGQSQASAEKWVDSAESSFTLSVESFSKNVRDYLDKQGKDRRVVFLVDEVGAFIGRDGGLMLNLQTIVENLGTVCQGRAWVVVTAQEELDKILGDMPKTAQNDFSKIQGRFKTRLSLSSANVDEVIQERLLAKADDPAVSRWLADTFAVSGDILKNQLSFTQCGMTFPQFEGSDDFARTYPFAPYQFKLLQKVFEAIRRKGATGMNLAQGERSLLDAFQSAAQAVADEPLGVLVPLYRFYPSIEGFLETSVRRTIDHARDNPALEPFDNEILRVLFLIRYVDEMRGTIDNLTTLCTDRIDADRLALKRKIEDSLARLEKETLINRSGDTYFFLTNEERDVNREIKQVDLSAAEEAKALGDIIFEDLYKGQKRFRYSKNKRDFEFNRLCDGFPIGSRLDKALSVQVYTPLADVEQEALADGFFLRLSGQDDGQIVIRLDDSPALGRELRQYLQTEKYLRSRLDDSLPETTKRIHKDLAHDNTERRKRLELMLSELIGEATFFACTQRLNIKAGSPQTALDEALEYLVENTTPKLTYITKYADDPRRELQAILRANDLQKAAMDGLNERALDEVREYVDLASQKNHPIVLYPLVERFAGRPWGWPDDETLILVARLLVMGEIQLIRSAEPIPLEEVYDQITATQKQRQITVVRRNRPDPEKLAACRKLGQELFGEMGPTGEEALHDFLKARFADMKASLATHRAVAEARSYPGLNEITDAQSLVAAILAPRDSSTFFERLLENKAALDDLAYDYPDVNHFYTHQRPQWDRLAKAAERFGLNRPQLEQDAAVAASLARMHEILKAKSPYKILSEAEGLIEKVEKVNQALVEQARAASLAAIDRVCTGLEAKLAPLANDGLSKSCLTRLASLRDSVTKDESVAHITQAVSLADQELEAALAQIDSFLKARAKADAGTAEKPLPPPKPRREIRPAEFVQTGWLETEADIAAFLDRLREELKSSLNRGERIHIR
jgi:hypothetical protein